MLYTERSVKKLQDSTANFYLTFKYEITYFIALSEK